MNIATVNSKAKAEKISKGILEKNRKDPQEKSVTELSKKEKEEEKKNQKVDDSLNMSKSIVFHSTSSQELYNIIFLEKFTPGVGGGAMLGTGFYANQHLYQAKKHNYGQYILKAEVSNIDQFFFAEAAMYNEFFSASVSDFDELVKTQLRNKNMPEVFPSTTRISNQSSASWLANSGFWRVLRDAGFRGIVYYGDFDKESIVAWFISDITPLGLSDDDGKTWKNPKEVAKEYVSTSREASKSSKEEFEKTKKENLRHGDKEWVRSYQRALDLKDRYEGKTDEQIERAVRSQLSSIKDPDKLKIRKEVFEDVFERKFDI